MEILLFAAAFVLLFVLSVAAVFGWRGVQALAALFILGVIAGSSYTGIKLYNDAHPHYDKATEDEIAREWLSRTGRPITPGEMAFEERLRRAGRQP